MEPTIAASINYVGEMTDDRIAVSVARDLAELMPAYMANRGKEVDALRAAVAARDLNELGRLGNRMRGVGEPFGFNKVSALGKVIEDAAKTGDHLGLKKCVTEYAEYLELVQVVYV